MFSLLQSVSNRVKACQIHPNIWNVKYIIPKHSSPKLLLPLLKRFECSICVSFAVVNIKKQQLSTLNDLFDFGHLKCQCASVSYFIRTCTPSALRLAAPWSLLHLVLPISMHSFKFVLESFQLPKIETAFVQFSLQQIICINSMLVMRLASERFVFN